MNPTELKWKRRAWASLSALLDQDDKKRLLRGLVLILVAGIFETVSIASVLPFLDTVANAGTPSDRPAVAWLYERFGSESRRAFVIMLGCGTLGLLLAGNALAALSQWKLYGLANRLTQRMSGRLLGAYLRAPYDFHLGHSAVELSRGVLSETEQVVQGVVLPAMFIISRALVASLTIGMLIVIEPLVALIAVVALGGSYAGVLAATRRAIRRAGAMRSSSNQARFQVTSESLSAIREVKVYECEHVFDQRFEKASKDLAKAYTSQQTIAGLPKYAVEVLAFGSIVLLAIAMTASGQTAGSGVARLGLFAFAGYRLAPALQLCFSSLTSIRYSLPALDRLERDLRTTPGDAAPLVKTLGVPLPTSEILLEDVAFTYAGRDQSVFEKVSITIPIGSSVAIVGQTGSGKSTILDLICGLLRPRSGHLSVDGRRITDEDIRSWRRHIAYVSQHSVLMDSSIRENIAFGLDPSEIDDERVRQCAVLACLSEFVEKELPECYDSRIGDRAVRMSGGQRQRLAIARALYSKRPILVLDEATSALDPETEACILRNLHDNRAGRTLVLVTHRATLATRADRIYDMRQFRRVAESHADRVVPTPGGSGSTLVRPEVSGEQCSPE